MTIANVVNGVLLQWEFVSTGFSHADNVQHVWDPDSSFTSSAGRARFFFFCARTKVAGRRGVPVKWKRKKDHGDEDIWTAHCSRKRRKHQARFDCEEVGREERSDRWTNAVVWRVGVRATTLACRARQEGKATLHTRPKFLQKKNKLPEASTITEHILGEEMAVNLRSR